LKRTSQYEKRGDHSYWDSSYLFARELETHIKHERKSEEKGGDSMAQDKFHKVLEQLSGLSGFEGAVVISEEGLVMASHFIKEQPEDVVAALIQETVNMAQQVIEQAKWGILDNLVIETEDDHKLILYRTKFGYVALLGNKNLNLGLARVTVDEAAEELEKS
jgi:predicted regulator of Ras-like GTPase activity (Roadblock/LC7/MglB family)